MHRVRLVTMEPDEEGLLGYMKEHEIFREPVKGYDPHFPEYDYYCFKEQYLRGLIAEHWGEGDWVVERLPEPADRDLAAETASRMLEEAEVDEIGLTAADVFDRWCDWQGLVYWGPRLRGVVADVLGRRDLWL